MHACNNPVLTSRQVKLAATTKPVPRFGGPVSLIAFFERIGLAAQVRALMPFAQTSPNPIPPAHTHVAFSVPMVAVARRLAHTDCMRADKALQALLGVPQFPGTDTVRNRFAPLPIFSAIVVSPRTRIAEPTRRSHPSGPRSRTHPRCPLGQHPLR